MQSLADTILIGVDGGGTGCRVAIGTDRRGLLAEVCGGRANATSDFDLAIDNIKKAVALAAVQAGLDLDDAAPISAHLGLAGVLTAGDAQKVADALPYTQCIVTDDRPTAITGALDGQDGFLVSVGTGTIIGKARDAAFRFIGGWGFHLADQASGAWLGRAALDRTLQCYDKVLDHSPLTQNILTRFDGDPNKVAAFSFVAKPGDYGTFAPDVLDAAAVGDPIGLELVTEGADYICGGLVALGFKPGDALCLSGGVGPHYAPYLPKQMASCVIAAKHSAVYGAFQMARHSARNIRQVPV
ncbi:MAG: BadF/BadG/BcrA/BcrD ATPase family protein [Sulfitobacter sp.]